MVSLSYLATHDMKRTDLPMKNYKYRGCTDNTPSNPCPGLLPILGTGKHAVISLREASKPGAAAGSMGSAFLRVAAPVG